MTKLRRDREAARRRRRGIVAVFDVESAGRDAELISEAVTSGEAVGCGGDACRQGLRGGTAVRGCQISSAQMLRRFTAL
jgi:hypothetical protein